MKTAAIMAPGSSGKSDGHGIISGSDTAEFLVSTPLPDLGAAF
jgi:hypothetical protein